MKPDYSYTLTLLLYALATTILGNCWHVASASASTAVRTAAAQAGKNTVNVAGLIAYPDASAYMSAPSTGSISYQPHDSAEELANERAVYDPGDELLRALNAEMAASGQELGTLPEEPDYADTVTNELEVANKFEMLRKLENDLREEQDIVSKSALLMKMIEDPSLDTLPVVYVEEDPLEDEKTNLLFPISGSGMVKRSRYYRRYPWKRHNRNRSTYEPELRYACTPTKEDVFKLLVNLHENRKGNHSKTVNFCNRKRPAKAIFTNIRFLG